MNREPHSFALLRAIDPVADDRVSADSPQARAMFERIVADVRQPQRPRRRRAVERILGWLAVPRFQLAAGSSFALVATLIVVLVVISGSTASPAFAGWSATPTSPSPGQIAASLRGCNSLVPVVIVDTRGPYTAAVFSGRQGGVACLQGPSSSAAGGMSGLSAGPHPVAAGHIQTFVLTGSDSKGNGFVLLAGRVGSGVTGVTIHRINGGDVVASVKDGWYLAWWPARVRAVNATVTTTHGSRVINLPPAATQRSVSCGGPPNSACGSAGGSGSGGSALGGPPLIQGIVQKPFGSTLLLIVSNARRVQLCLHPGLRRPGFRSGPPPPTNCLSAHLLTKLPRSWPVQRNLLELFGDSIWIVKLPRQLEARIDRRRAVEADVSAFSPPGPGDPGGRVYGGVGLGW